MTDDNEGTGGPTTVTTYAWRRLDLEGVTFVRLEQGDDAVRVEGAERWASGIVEELGGGWEHGLTGG